MRFVWAVVAFVLATLMIGAGIAQRTVLRGPESVEQTVSIDGDAPYVVLDSGVLRMHPGTQTLSAEGDGTVFAAYGRTDDIHAWLSRSEYAHVTVNEDGEIEQADIAPEVEAAPEGDPAADPATDPAAEPVTEDAAADAAPAPTPVGSDLWLEEFQREDELTTPLQLPEGTSVLLASDGTASAPAEVRLTWPIASNTPWAGPLIVGGSLLLAAGIVLYVLGWRHLRRSRGPRRKGLPLTATQPIDLAVDDPDAHGVISATPTRRRLTRGGRSLVAVPISLALAVAVTGCSADAWPQFGPSPTPSPTQTLIDEDEQDAPAVTSAQAERILARIADTVGEADAAGDATLAATRLAGPALAERETNYTLRAAVAEHGSLPAIAAEPLSILLPQAYEQWPRTFLAVVEDAADAPDTIMIAVQQDPWSEYKVTYIAELATDTFPNLAPDYLGAPQVPPASAFLVLPPDQLAMAYADVITYGETSNYAGLFEAGGDPFREAVAAKRAENLARFNETAAETGDLTFSTAPGTEAPIALQTLESGAIVAVTMTEDETATPKNEDAVIKAEGNVVTSTLAGVTQSSTGFTTTYADQLFFYVPGAGSTEPIQFLGYRSNPLSAKVVSQ